MSLYCWHFLPPSTNTCTCNERYSYVYVHLVKCCLLLRFDIVYILLLHVLPTLVTLTTNKMLGELVNACTWIHARVLNWFTPLFSSTVSTLQSKLKNVKMTNDDLSTQVHKLSLALCVLLYEGPLFICFFNRPVDDAGYCGHCGLMVSMLTSWSSRLGWQALARGTVLCSWARHFTLIVPLSTQMYNGYLQI